MRPVSISLGAFWFCRLGVAILLWVAIIFRIPELVYLSTIILILSAILGVDKAPMILIYASFEKLFMKKPKKTMLDLPSMRFAHSLGSLFGIVCSALIFFNSSIALGATIIFALVKTVSALGVCPAQKLYACIGGQCCMSKKKK